MWVLKDMEAEKLLKVVKALDAWCYEKRYTDPEEPKFGLLVYAEGLRDGMTKVLETMGITIKGAT